MSFSEKILNNLGFSTICIDKLEKNIGESIIRKFSYLDIGLKQIGRFDSPILSVQSLVDYEESEGASLMKDERSFFDLKQYFFNKLPEIRRHGINSAILGSPGIRIGSSISKRVLNSRALELVNLFREFDVLLYIEALPVEICDAWNRHDELLALHENLDYGIHVDIATLLYNEENIEWCEENISSIDRFHLSIPRYGYDFHEYPSIDGILDIFIDNGIKGTVEIQNFSDWPSGKKYLI